MGVILDIGSQTAASRKAGCRGEKPSLELMMSENHGHSLVRPRVTSSREQDRGEFLRALAFAVEQYENNTPRAHFNACQIDGSLDAAFLE